MRIKKLFSILYLILLSGVIIGQADIPQRQPAQVRDNHNWKDTTLTPVYLRKIIRDKKVVMIALGKKTVIYVGKDELTQGAAHLTNDLTKDCYNRIIQFGNSAFVKRNTVLMGQYTEQLDYQESETLQEGSACVFYEKHAVFVPLCLPEVGDILEIRAPLFLSA